MTRDALAIGAAGLLLVWPAFYNGYPLVFADTGTYIGQATELFMGWDRPVFYSFFLLLLHWKLTTWMPILAQGLMAAGMLYLSLRCFAPRLDGWWVLPIAGVLAVLTGLPWFAAQLMPDLFTPLLALAAAMLVIVPERLSPRERWLVAGGAAFMIAAHQSNVPIFFGLTAALLVLRRRLGAPAPLGRRGLLYAVLPGVAAVAALVGVNLIGQHRASISPYGNVFLLARVIYDGPGRDVLERDCPQAGWRLCAFAHSLPPTADDFLWRADGPVARAGGGRAVSAEAGQIIERALRAEPAREISAALRNAAVQFGMFATGDGLQAWPGTVTVWIERNFPPFEVRAYLAARQQRGLLAVPDWMVELHAGAVLAGMLATGLALGVAVRRRHPVAGLCAAVLLCLVGNAIVTGALSGPHDRYQSRVVWLVTFAPLVAIGALGRGARVEVPGGRQRGSGGAALIA